MANACPKHFRREICMLVQGFRGFCQRITDPIAFCSSQDMAWNIGENNCSLHILMSKSESPRRDNWGGERGMQAGWEEGGKDRQKEGRRKGERDGRNLASSYISPMAYFLHQGLTSESLHHFLKQSHQLVTRTIIHVPVGEILYSGYDKQLKNTSLVCCWDLCASADDLIRNRHKALKNVLQNVEEEYGSVTL